MLNHILLFFYSGVSKSNTAEQPLLGTSPADSGATLTGLVLLNWTLHMCNRSSWTQQSSGGYYTFEAEVTSLTNPDIGS